MPINVETNFGIFNQTEVVNLNLARNILSNKSLISFNSNLSKFDFKILLEQISNNGIKIYWNQSKINPKEYNFIHLAIIEKSDVNFVKLISSDAKEFDSNKLFEELENQ